MQKSHQLNAIEQCGNFFVTSELSSYRVKVYRGANGLELFGEPGSQRMYPNSVRFGFIAYKIREKSLPKDIAIAVKHKGNMEFSLSFGLVDRAMRHFSVPDSELAEQYRAPQEIRAIDSYRLKQLRKAFTRTDNRIRPLYGIVNICINRLVLGMDGQSDMLQCLKFLVDLKSGLKAYELGDLKSVVSSKHGAFQLLRTQP